MKEGTLTIQGLQAGYRAAGEGPAFFILHGWGSSGKNWESIGDAVAQKGFRVYALDLPGFGASSAPQEVWGVEEYARFLYEFTEQLGIKKFFLAGHSFGGQIAIQFAAHHPEKIDKLILLAAAGVRRDLATKEKTLRFLAKPLNIFLSLIPSERAQDALRVLAYRMVGRSDYASAKGIMRKVMGKVVREDLTPLFSRIQVRTLIIWGDKDKMTPLEDALLMKEHIKDSLLKIFPGVGHRIRHEAPEKLQEAILEFLKK